MILPSAGEMIGVPCAAAISKPLCGLRAWLLKNLRSPKGLLIGEVTRVAKERGRLYKYAVIETSSELSKLEEVLCIE